MVHVHSFIPDVNYAIEIKEYTRAERVTNKIIKDAILSADYSADVSKDKACTVFIYTDYSKNDGAIVITLRKYTIGHKQLVSVRINNTKAQNVYCRFYDRITVEIEKGGT